MTVIPTFYANNFILIFTISFRVSITKSKIAPIEPFLMFYHKYLEHNALKGNCMLFSYFCL